MVRVFLAFLVTLLLLQADQRLDDKVREFLSERDYRVHNGLIRLLFKNSGHYYEGESLKIIPIMRTLKENGLLKLFFTSPQRMQLTFKSRTNPIFFAKIMNEALHLLGYTRYLLTNSSSVNGDVIWEIALTSEYAIDPLLLNQMLLRFGSKIEAIDRIDPYTWEYGIDTSNAFLRAVELQVNERKVIKSSLKAIWINAEQGNSVRLQSIIGNRWYPYIALYDQSLNVIKVINRDKITHSLNLSLPRGTKYIKLADRYQLSNMKQGIRVTLQQ